MNKEFKDLFYEKLSLGELDYREQNAFLVRMNEYLVHGRTVAFVSEKIDKLLEFLNALDLGTREAVRILTLYPTILNIVETLYDKYIFLGCIENMDNTVRIQKLLNSPRDFMISLNKMYARFMLIIESGYNNFTWNNLVHASDNEFCKIFIAGTYNKPYQMFEEKEQVMDYLAKVNFEGMDLSYFKEMRVNEELVSRYEKKGRKR